MTQVERYKRIDPLIDIETEACNAVRRLFSALDSADLPGCDLADACRYATEARERLEAINGMLVMWATRKD